MPWFHRPTLHEWKDREHWFENELEEHVVAGHVIGEQSHALLSEVQLCYCCGAWLAVIILSISAIDSQLRETEYNDKNTNTKKLIEIHNLHKRIDDFRKLRNRLVHVDTNQPIITFDDYHHEEFESLAKEAALLMIEVFFLYPWI